MVPEGKDPRGMAPGSIAPSILADLSCLGPGPVGCHVAGWWLY